MAFFIHTNDAQTEATGLQKTQAFDRTDGVESGKGILPKLVERLARKGE